MPAQRRFEATPETILKELGSALRKMGATGARIETAARISKEFTKHLARIGVAVVWCDPLVLPPPAVRLVFDRDGRRFPYECGKWASVLDNLRAVQRTVSHLYAIYEDYGVTGEASTEAEARASFEQIMTLGAGEFRWWEVLGVAQGAGPAEIRAAYNALALRHHPDKGGQRADWDRVQRAYEEATKGG